MIAVVVLLELRARLFVGLPVRPGKFLDVFRKIVQKLLFTYAADVGIVRIPGDCRIWSPLSAERT